jgi:hypothetical protein
MTKLSQLKNADTDRAKVNKWLDSIGEVDPYCRAEVLEQCKDDPDARAYYVSRYEETK